MDQTIGNADFMHTEDDDRQHAFTQSHSDWDRNSENISFAEVQACFKAIQAKVCRPDFPPEGTSGYYMAYHLLRSLIGIADDLVEEGRAQAADIQEIYLEFILGMIQAGPLSSHSEYIYLLMDDSQVEFSNFYQSLRGERLKSIVLSLKKEYRPDAGMEVESFFSHHFDRFWRVVVSDGFSEEQFEEAHCEFLELFSFFRRSFTDREREMWKAMHNLSWQIELKFDRNIYQGIEDVSVLKDQLAAISRQILDPRFPQTEEVGKEAQDDLSKLLKVVSQKGLLSQVYEGIMDLALDLTIKKAGCEGTRQHFETIGYFFFHLQEESVKDNKMGGTKGCLRV